MSKAAQFTKNLVIIGVLVLCVSGALAGDRDLVFHIDEPIAVGDQIYAAGDVALRHLQAANLVALRINGQHIGILANTGWNSGYFGARPFMICERGQDGVLRFRGVRYKSEIDSRVHEITFAAVALNPGIAPLDPRLPEAMTRVAATR